LGLVLVAAQAGAALGGSPLAAPERRPTVTSAEISGEPVSGGADTTSATVRVVVVRPGDSLWSIAQRLTPGEDPRPVVDEVDRARGGAPLVPGETILWPR
jgi:Tfp pilus assembly protein FimV